MQTITQEQAYNLIENFLTKTGAPPLISRETAQTEAREAQDRLRSEYVLGKMSEADYNKRFDSLQEYAKYNFTACKLLSGLGTSFKFGGLLFSDEATVSCGKKWGSKEMTVTVNWSSSMRSTAQAAVALAAYQEAVVFALRLEAFLSELPTIED